MTRIAFTGVGSAEDFIAVHTATAARYARIAAALGERAQLRRHLDAIYDALGFAVQHHGDDELAPRVRALKAELTKAKGNTQGSAGNEAVDRVVQAYRSCIGDVRAVLAARFPNLEHALAGLSATALASPPPARDRGAGEETTGGATS